MATDPTIAETKRIFDELAAARKGVVGNREPDPLKKARHDRAQDAAHEHRKMLRRVGQFVGDRAYPTDEQIAAGLDPDSVYGVRTANDETNPPSILKEES